MLKILLTALTAFVIVLLLGPLLIPVLARLRPAQAEKDITPEQPPQQSTKKKQAPPPKPPVPTMGGALVMVAVLIATIVFGMDGMEFALPSVVAMVAFGILGFVDDFIRIRDIDGIGLRGSIMLGAELLFAGIIAIWAYRSPMIGSSLYLPISGKEWDIGLWYVPLVILTVMTQVNAAHLSESMDGLVTGVSATYSLSMIAIFAAMATMVNQEGELLKGYNFAGSAIFAAAVAGAGIGFLRYNVYPARIEPGSTGSLAFGGAVAMMGILSRSLIILPLMSACLLVSLGSVLLQSFGSAREGGKKLFRAVPLHRHFEAKGHPASQIATMYTIVTALICAVCLLPYFR